jgi:hypothetical protein
MREIAAAGRTLHLVHVIVRDFDHRHAAGLEMCTDP